MLRHWRNAAGKLIRGSDRKLVRCIACPCEPCNLYSASIQVTFSGLTACCASEGTGGYFHADASNFNTTFTLTGVSGSWSYTGNATGTGYADSECTISPTVGTRTFSINVACEAATGNLLITASLNLDDATASIFTSDSYHPIGGTFTSTNTCDSLNAQANGTATIAEV